MRGVARDNHGAGKRNPRLDRIGRKRRQNLLHRLVKVDLDDSAVKLRFVDMRQKARRIVLKFF